MKRKIYSKLLAWKAATERKPLILKGARQVGKSWILKEFGRKEYKYTAYISFDNAPLATTLFKDYDTERILRSVEALTKTPIEPSSTLIIFDEIQEVEGGLTALKYFCENAPEYHVAVAGSLLGLTLNQGASFPVGKVDFLEMFPMDFEEFLWANDEVQIAGIISSADTDTLSTLHEKCVELLRQYYVVGGMPEVVSLYIKTGSTLKVRSLQRQLLEAYKNDISKHAPLKEVQRIHIILNSLPAQLAKENRKFIYSLLRKGARAADFEIAIQWLVDAGIVLKTCLVTRPSLPLKIYEDFNTFKLYFLDCGLYGALADADPADILLSDTGHSDFKGSFSELYVLQQFIANGITPVYYYQSPDSRVEIDFIIKVNRDVYPVEVKAEGNVRGKSVKIFREKYGLPLAIRLSMLPYVRQETLVNLPLYAAFSLEEWLLKR